LKIGKALQVKALESRKSPNRINRAFRQDFAAGINFI
jgi:hypothetical protein